MPEPPRTRGQRLMPEGEGDGAAPDRWSFFHFLPRKDLRR